MTGPSDKFIARTRVVDVRFERDEEHEWRSIMAIRRREHPSWSQYACGYRVGETA
jgi:hypothetical protein